MRASPSGDLAIVSVHGGVDMRLVSVISMIRSSGGSDEEATAGSTRSDSFAIRAVTDDVEGVRSRMKVLLSG